MARPAKSANITDKYGQTKEETANKKAIEKQLSAEGLPEPPEYLTERQKEIFFNIEDLLKDSGFLALNDVYILAKTAVAIDRIEFFEGGINTGKLSPVDSKVIGALRAYTADFYRGCNELCLSPQGRAKLAGQLAVKKEKAPAKSVFDEVRGNL
ncbi:MAG: P27 family phage terminase small subunit [Eubacterium sp.]|nr:P27 family phage terminase small subunit [Eubacterium sp.]